MQKTTKSKLDVFTVTLRDKLSCKNVPTPWFQKAVKDGLSSSDIVRLGELLSAARERMVCLRASKRKHKFVPCWPACQNLIEDLKGPGG